MNDDFLKNHNVRPDAEFVEKLYQDLEKSEQRTLSRFFSKDKFNLWLKSATVMGLLVIGFFAYITFTTTDAPDVIQAWLAPETAKLVSVTTEAVEPGAISSASEILHTLPSTSELVVIEGGSENENEITLDIPEGAQEIIPITLMRIGDEGPYSQEIAQHRINGLVNEPQKFNNQGPATLAIMLNYYGDDTTQNKAASYLKPSPQDRNVSPWQISDYVNTFTQLRSITQSNGSQQLLLELIASDFPVVIEKGYDAEAFDASGWYGHYLILYGYNDVAQEFNTIDTFLGPFTTSDLRQSEGGAETLADGYLYSYDHIDTYWQQFNRTFYLVYDPAREEELFAILEDQVVVSADSWLAAIEQAQTDIQTDPANPFAWFNLGTSFTELGKITNEPAQFENAAEAFDTAFDIGLPDRMLWYQHGPFIAYREVGRYQDILDLADEVFKESGGRTIEEVWLHQGHAQAHLQDYEGALDSYSQALDLNENFYPAQFSRDYIEDLLNTDS